MITITRENGYADKLRNYKVIIDSKVVGEIADGQTKTFDVSKGSHTLRLGVDWAKSNEVEFDSSGKEIRFKCGNALKGLRIILAIFYATFLAHKYLKLQRVD